MAHELQFDLQFSLLRKVVLAIFVRQYAGFTAAALILFLLSVVCLFTEYAIPIGCFILGVSISYLAWLILSYIQSIRYWKATPDKRVLLRFDYDGITFERFGAVTTYRWRTVRTVWPLPEAIVVFLFIQKSVYLIIPRASLTSEVQRFIQSEVLAARKPTNA
jgi:ABC-type Fe3+-siderophore transport system permease subunit